MLSAKAWFFLMVCNVITAVLNVVVFVVIPTHSLFNLIAAAAAGGAAVIARYQYRRLKENS